MSAEGFSVSPHLGGGLILHPYVEPAVLIVVGWFTEKS